MKFFLLLVLVPLLSQAAGLKKVDYKEKGVETQEREPASPSMTEEQRLQMMQTLEKAKKYREEEKKYLEELDEDL